jgi:uncharacterized Zn-finger protein
MINKNINHIASSKTKVSCNGSQKSSSHPKIFLDLSVKKETICPYCGFKFTFVKK